MIQVKNKVTGLLGSGLVDGCKGYFVNIFNTIHNIGGRMIEVEGTSLLGGKLVDAQGQAVLRCRRLRSQSLFPIIIFTAMFIILHVVQL